MRDHLDTVGRLVKRIFESHLPRMGDDWWERGVIKALSFQQRKDAAERGWRALDDLDVAALFVALDNNWDMFIRWGIVTKEGRNWLKEAISIRHRYAHEPVGSTREPRRAYRDVDTLFLLAQALDPQAPEIVELEAARDALLPTREGTAPRDEMPVAAPDDSDGPDSGVDWLVPAALVRLRARPEIVGVVMSVDRGQVERTAMVFHDGSAHQYFESQLEPQSTGPQEKLNAAEMRTGFTAAELLNPAVSRLYSFNTGRIEYEPYQFRPVMKLINSDRPRLLIADDVGVGKTIEAGLIIKELQARQRLDSILVICPKQLVVESKWRQELRRFDEDFIELDSATLRYCLDEARLEGQWPARYRKAILPYSLLDERLLMGQGEGRSRRHGLLSIIPPVKFDLVIVDEAHHLRNRETWRHRVVSHLLASSEAAVLVSATPIQTGSSDLFNLLRLLRPDTFTDSGAFDRMKEPNAFIAEADAVARRGGPDWQLDALIALEGAAETAWGKAVMMADPRMDAVRTLLEDEDMTEEKRVRVVRLLQNLNTFSGLINRTRRRDIGNFTVRKPETHAVDFTPEQQLVHDELLDLCRRILAPRAGSQSLEFLLSTLRRQASSSLNGLAPFIHDVLNNRLGAEELSEADFEGETLAANGLLSFRSEIQVLAHRASELREDPKLDSLFSIVQEKRKLENNKVLVFSTFRHTLAYILPRLREAGVRVGLVHGGVPDDDRREIRSRFALDRQNPDALDVLLSSEVGTEGLDNQFCDALVNYDIPWNPMRIEQRIGRIDRRGQKSESISIKNLIVNGTVDAAIYERCLLRIGVFHDALGASEEILGEMSRELHSIAEDLTLTDAERDAKLQQLADNKLARVQEQTELEEREAALFGLAVQKLDEDGVAASASPWLATPQMARLVEEYLERQGHDRAPGMFDRPVAVFRPDRQTRAVLVDAARSDPENAGNIRWRRWLEDAGDATRRLTFDPALAEDEGVELLSAAHGLVRAAARAIGVPDGEVEVPLRVASDEVPSGRYPFAVFGWRTLGLKDNYELAVVATESKLGGTVGGLLLRAEDGDSALTDAEADAIEVRHYEKWLEARAQHIEETTVHIAAQLASLELSHRARVAQLEDQLAEASHPNIVRMRESELRSVEEDFARRRTDLQRAESRCDITTSRICRGVLEVVSG
jgi:ATP-dependent helicase HepA